MKDLDRVHDDFDFKICDELPQISIILEEIISINFLYTCIHSSYIIMSLFKIFSTKSA